MSFPRYPKYKDSGVDWLGQVPEYWELRPLCGAATERYEPNEGMLEDNLLSLSYGRIVQKDITANDGLLPESFETYQIVHPGDIVFRLTDLQNDKRSLRSALVEEKGIITSAYLAVVPRGPDSRYLSYLFRAYDVTKVFYSMGGGLRQSMKFADMKRLPTLLPPPPEQSRIAEFLGRQTAKIDALVAEQERLLTLLKEKRQAVISKAVTKGLNPQAALKPSGIEWLGDVPAHWKIAPLKWYSRCCSGDGLPSDKVESLEGENQSVQAIGGNGLMGYTVQGNINHSVLVVGRVGALCGNVHIVHPPAWITDTMELRLQRGSRRTRHKSVGLPFAPFAPVA
jgi:type I restriction enzyme S subunit